VIVGILGAGRIAQSFDAPGAAHVLSLAHAVSRSTAFRLGGFFDVRAERAVAAERRWGCAPSPRTREAWLDSGWDVVCIATPEAAQAEGDRRREAARARLRCGRAASRACE
jgi:predicted dehydrogenase